MINRCAYVIAAFLLSVSAVNASEASFAGVVSSASPEASAAGVAILEAGGNAIDAAVAVSLTLGVTEPAGSGIAGQTVMLIKRPGEPAVVIQGTTWSPRVIPEGATTEQLRSGRTASTVPSTLRVLDTAYRKFGGGYLRWTDLLQPAIDSAEQGFVVGPFRHRSFRNYASSLAGDATAARIFLRPGGSVINVGDTVRQPLLAATLKRLAAAGAMDFYEGEIAKEIAADLAENGGWITADDLQRFPEPQIVPAIRSSYRGFDVETLPPPFGGWVVLQILNVLEQSDRSILAHDDSARRLALLDALRIGHTSRRNEPVTDYRSYADAVSRMTSKPEAKRLLDEYRGGETTHFSVVDGSGTVVAVTQSIDSYFGASVAHPTLGFLYNNYMQGFQVDDPDAPYYLSEFEMPLSSMSATVVSKQEQPLLALGSPGSARIISAVAQVTSHWIDIDAGIEQAVAAYRVHIVPDDKAYIEGPEVPTELLAGMAARGLRLVRPTYGVSDSHLDPYFGGIHAVAFEDGAWTGAADPRRDGEVGIATLDPGRSRFRFTGWAGPAIDVRLFKPDDFRPDTPVVIVMHGWSRDAQRYFDDWSALGREHGFVAVVPYFPVADFPTANEYNLGHVFDEASGEQRPQALWTFSAIEPLFDEVVARLGSTRTSYTLYGHSAGSQFVHRFAYYMQGSRAQRLLAANAGWYTLPDLETPYPYGLEDAAVTDAGLAAAFRKDVVLLLGREDTNFDDPTLRKTEEARRQGPNRFVRGHTMFSVAEAKAAELGADLNWRVVIVEDAGHVNRDMAAVAATLVEP